jgi:hypothetical protein
VGLWLLSSPLIEPVFRYCPSSLDARSFSWDLILPLLFYSFVCGVMDFYSADEQAVHPYSGPASMNQDAFSFPAQHQVNQFQRQTFSQSNATGLLISNDNYGDNYPAGLGRTSNAASQLMKRSRTNSDEASQGLLPQILGLLSRASSDDQQKILLFLKGGTSSSFLHVYLC